MPTVARIEGFRFFFFSDERNEPPHIHVESAECYAKFWLEPVMLADSVGFKGSDLTRLRKLVAARAGEFEEKWHEHFAR